MNAANEVAVEAFCSHRLPFLGISEVVERVCEALTPVQDYSLESIMAADTEARLRAWDAAKLLGS